MSIFYLLIEIVLYLSELVCQIMVLMKVKLFLGGQNHRKKSSYVASEFIALRLLVGIC
jgi:hypothetical protein